MRQTRTCRRFYDRLQSRRTGFRRESGISGEEYVVNVPPLSRLKPVLREARPLWEILCLPATADPGGSEFIREEAGTFAALFTAWNTAFPNEVERHPVCPTGQS